ncbi:MAG: acetylglutamate kinase [Verrucomicrobiota bacterium]|jgi:acetylglutamate kinase|nr:acetylglutamate kinase [Verrucomicrobiota bacterium]
MQELISKATTLLEALPYIQRFSGATFVVKYGGSFMDSPDEAVRTGVASDVVFLEAVEINPVVVHGGGKRISKALEAAGVESRFVNGLRYTDAASVEIVDRVLSSEINGEIVEMINSLGGVAKSFSGTDIFTCKKHAPDGEDYGFVGEATGVNTSPLEECIAQGTTPVISPTARDAEGQTYNCNADIAAAQAAIALAAKRLVFMSDVPGLLRDPDDTESVIPHLNIAEVDKLKQAGIIAKGMIPKVDSAVAAINAGVDKVSFVDGRINHAVLLEIFTDKGVGTEIVK